jgi:hypothetical protein
MTEVARASDRHMVVSAEGQVQVGEAVTAGHGERAHDGSGNIER